MQRLLPPVLLLFCAAAMVLAQFFFPMTQIAPWPIRLIALLPLVLGMFIAVVGKQQFVKQGTNLYTFNDPDKMITTGLYAYSRNPMYLGFVIVAFSIALLLGSLIPLGIALIHWVVVDRWYISFEEKRMVEKFGENYNDYKKRVRRWI